MKYEKVIVEVGQNYVAKIDLKPAGTIECARQPDV